MARVTSFGRLETRDGHPSPRARDFVDIHTVVEHFKIDVATRTFFDVLAGTFAAKRVPLRLLGKIKDARESHRDDFLAVQETVHPGFVLRDFDYYFACVVGLCSRLEALWVE